MSRQNKLRIKRAKYRVFINRNPVCVQCGSTENLTVDHKIPLSWGAVDDQSNWQVLCYTCNQKKGATSDEYVKLWKDGKTYLVLKKYVKDVGRNQESL